MSEGHKRAMSMNCLVSDLDIAVNGCHLRDLMHKVYPLRKGGKVLEACCGSGKLGLSYAIHGAAVDLLDHEETDLVYARRMAEGAQVLLGSPLYMTFILASVFQIPQPDNYYDFIFSDGAHEHWLPEKRREAIRETIRVLKPGGRLFIAVPNIRNPAQLKASQESVFHWDGMEEKEQLITEMDLEKDLTDLGMLNVQKGAEGRVAFAWGDKPGG